MHRTKATDIGSNSKFDIDPYVVIQCAIFLDNTKSGAGKCLRASLIMWCVNAPAIQNAAIVLNFVGCFDDISNGQVCICERSLDLVCLVPMNIIFIVFRWFTCDSMILAMRLKCHWRMWILRCLHSSPPGSRVDDLISSSVFLEDPKLFRTSKEPI